MQNGNVARFEVLEERECFEHLRTRDIGRVAFHDGKAVDVFPINYGCDGETVIFRTASGSRLHRLAHAEVTFEVDSWDPAEGVGWSVVLKGVSREITRATDQFSKALRSRELVPLAPGTRERWIAIFAAEVTGRRFSRAPAGNRAAGG